jgi:predicted RNA-binding Zn ribbon-like protein
MAPTTVRDPQPGGRAPAPGSLALVQAFVNSNYDLEIEHGAELLDSPDGLREWLARRGLIEAGTSVSARDLQEAVAMRESLREMLITQRGNLQLPVDVRLRNGRPEFAAATNDARGALGLILAHAAKAMLDGSWQRLKACRECSWAFYDHSKNQAGSWCSMKICGGRVKQRRYYANQS